MEIKKYKFDWNDLKSQKVFESSVQNLSMPNRFLQQTESLIKNFGFLKTHLILDFGCGTGEHAILFKEMGFNIIGYDQSEYYITKGKKISVKEGFKVDLIHSADSLKSYEGSFDFIYTIDFPIYYINEDSIRSVLRSLYGLLRDDGEFLFGFPYTRENREKYLPINKWNEIEGVLHLSDTQIDSDGNRFERYIVVDSKRGTLTEWIDEARYYYLNEIKEFLTNSKFNICDQFENLDKKISPNPIDVHYLYCKKGDVDTFTQPNT